MFYIHIEDVGSFWSNLNANLQTLSSLIDAFVVMMAISTIAMICLQIWHSLVVEAKQRKLWESIANNTESNVQEDTMGNNQPEMADNKSNHDSKREQFENWIARRKNDAKRDLRKRSNDELKEIDVQSDAKIAKIDSMIAEFKAEIESLEAEKQQEPCNRTELLKDVRGRHDIELEKIVEPGLIERFGTLVFDSIDRVKSAVRNKALEVLGVKSEISELKERITQLELAVDPTKVPEPQIATQVEVEEEEAEVVKGPRIVLPPREDLFFVQEEPVVSAKEATALELREVVEELLEEADALRETQPVDALKMLRNHPIAKKYESIPKKRPFKETRKAYLRLIA